MIIEVTTSVGLSFSSFELNASAEEKIWLGTELGWTIEEDGIVSNQPFYD